MRTRLGWFGLVGIGMVAAGCGTSGVPIDDVGDEFVESVCEQLRRCPDQWRGEFGLFINLFEAEAQDASCEDFLANVPDIRRAPRDTAGVDAGTIAYDGAQARRCVRALVDSCIPFQLIGAVPECQGVFTGLTPVGDSCSATNECEPSAYCDLTSQCEGTCTARVTVGQPCDDDEACRASEGAVTSCELVDGETVCVEYTLVGGAAVGESCGAVDSEGTERTSAVCQAGLFCRVVDDVGSCAVPIAAGMTCTDDDVCERGYFCEDGSCRTVTFADEVGDACDPSTFTLCDPSLGLSCDEATSRCVFVSDGSEGSPCDTEDEFLSLFVCDEGLFCNRAAEAPTCTVPYENGDSCSNDAQCESGYCVDDECSAPVLCEEVPIFVPL